MKNAALSDRLRGKRIEKGLSMRELAEAAEVSQSYLSQLERGKRETPAAHFIAKIAHALDTTVEFLVEGVMKPEDPDLLRLDRPLDTEQVSEMTVRHLERFAASLGCVLEVRIRRGPKKSS